MAKIGVALMARGLNTAHRVVNANTIQLHQKNNLAFLAPNGVRPVPISALNQLFSTELYTNLSNLNNRKEKLDNLKKEWLANNNNRQEKPDNLKKEWLANNNNRQEKSDNLKKE
jgi:hypothetical protein